MRIVQCAAICLLSIIIIRTVPIQPFNFDDLMYIGGAILDILR